MIKDIYYHIEDDLQKYPDALWYLVIGARGCGKTYSALRYCVENHKKFCFVKRTAEDVKKLSLSLPHMNGLKDIRESASPFEPLNRDLGWNIRCYKAGNSDIAYFYECDELNYPTENILGCCVSLSTCDKVKGFDISKYADVLIFDEFIPQQWVRNVSKNGEQLLELYFTLTRDRVVRRPEDETLIFCLANATEADNPVMSELRIVDAVEDMINSNEEYYYDSYRGIMVHMVEDNPAFLQAMKSSKFARSIENTNYYKMAINNEFAMNDFTLIDKYYNISGCKPRFQVKFKDETWTYLEGSNNKSDYFTKRKVTVGKDIDSFDLNVEADQGMFRSYILNTVYIRIITRNVKFETYEIYNTMMEYMSKFPKSKIR